MNSFFSESLYPHYQQAFSVSRIIFEMRTDYQHLVIFENPTFGRVLALDGVIQTTEKDEFIYHEMMAHLPIFAHGAVRRVLVIGGGDGGIIREVLRHKTINEVVLVEIDEKVIEMSRQFLPNHSDGAFDDPRLKIVISDGNDFVSDMENGRFDLILSDSTDPIGYGEHLFSSKFYDNCAKRLGESGIFVAQNGVPFLQPEELTTTAHRLQPYFQQVGFYTAAVPTYVGGVMTMAFASQTGYHELPSAEIEARFQQAAQKAELTKPLRYYTPAIHSAAFSLPQYMLDLIRST